MKYYIIETYGASDASKWCVENDIIGLSFGSQSEAQARADELNEREFYAKNKREIAIVVAGILAGRDPEQLGPWQISIEDAADIVREIVRRGEGDE